jgi:hypothetical protein
MVAGDGAVREAGDMIPVLSQHAHRRRLQTTPFPLTLSGLALWLKADAGLYDATTGGSAVTSDAASVARWEDQSGNANHATQATSGKRAVLKLSIQNGRPSIRFDGSDDVFSLASSITPATCIAAFRRTATGIKSAPFGHNSTSVLEAPTWWTDNIFYLSFGGTERNAGAADTRTGAFITALTNDGSSSVFRVNGTAKTLSGALSGTLSLDLIGALSTVHFHSGDLLELIVSTAILTAGQIAQAETYLNGRWAAY